MKHEEWPEAVLESLKARHNQIYSQIEDQICSLGGAYHPTGDLALSSARGTHVGPMQRYTWV